MDLINSKRRRIIVYKDILNGGYTVMMAYLDTPYEYDEEVPIEIIRKLETLFHICDKGSAEKLIEVLSKIRDEWGDDDV